MVNVGSNFRLALAVFAVVFMFSFSGIANAVSSDDNAPSSTCCPFSPIAKLLGGGKSADAEDLSAADTTLEETPTTVEETDTTLDETDTTLEEVTTTTEPQAEETTTTEPETPTTIAEATTTSTSAPTTTQATIACAKNLDCGNTTVQDICVNGDLYAQETSPVCNNPGTVRAECKNKIKLVGQTMTQAAAPIEHCANGCRGGACI
jgi:hypothetical protein